MIHRLNSFVVSRANGKRLDGPSLALAAFLICLVGCQDSAEELDAERERWLANHRYEIESPPVVLKNLQWVETANPYKDAERAIRSGDFRFFAVGGHSMIVPGVPDSRCLALDQRKPLPGSVHALEGYEHQKLQAQAYVYADEYNYFLWLYQQEFGEFVCAWRGESS